LKYNRICATIGKTRNIKGSEKMDKLIETGKIVSVFGIKGEVKVQPWCDDPQLLCELDTLYYKSGTPVEIGRARVAKNIVVMKIKGVDTANDANKLRNRVLYLDRDDIVLEEGAFFIQDLIGLKVIDADNGREYGIITDVSQTGANDVYHIKAPDGKMYYIPAIKDVVKQTDIKSGEMLITPIEGLFEGAEEVR
jgi:16S rRNA processing protein RimM